MDFVEVNKAITKTKANVEHFREARQEFLLEIRNVVFMDKILLNLIIKFVQICIHWIPGMKDSVSKSCSCWKSHTTYFVALKKLIDENYGTCYL